jgi:hypothetical protein
LDDVSFSILTPLIIKEITMDVCSSTDLHLSLLFYQVSALQYLDRSLPQVGPQRRRNEALHCIPAQPHPHRRLHPPDHRHDRVCVLVGQDRSSSESGCHSGSHRLHWSAHSVDLARVVWGQDVGVLHAMAFLRRWTDLDCTSFESSFLSFLSSYYLVGRIS